MREGARERREEPRESEREQGGGRGVVPGHPDEEGRGRQAGEQVAWRGGARAPATLPSLCRGRRRQRREAGWAACWLGRPTGWAAQGGAQVSFSLLVFFCFLFYLIYLQLC